MRRRKLLIADDSEMNRAILANVLDQEFEVIEATNGQEVIIALQSYGTQISALLLDIVMPEMDGFEVLEEMNRRHWIEDIPTIMISAETSNTYIDRAFELGASDYISRPFVPGIVRRRIINTILLHTKKHQLMDVVADWFFRREKSNEVMISILGYALGLRCGEKGMHMSGVSRVTGLLLHCLMKRTNRYALNPDDIDVICMAASLHDIGKLLIPEEILTKPGKLTAEEFAIVKRHTVIGAEIISGMSVYQNEKLVKYATMICRWHHERWDGKGYPDGLAGDNIPIAAQVVSVADAYDALTNERSYKEAFSHDTALAMMHNGECGSLNPLLLECMDELSETLRHGVEKKPVGQSAEQVYETVEELYSGQDVIAARMTKQLEEANTKAEFFANLSGELWFEYTAQPSSLHLSKGAVEQTGLPDVIVDPMENEAFLSVFGKKTLALLTEKLQELPTDRTQMEFMAQITLNGKPSQCQTAILVSGKKDSEGHYSSLLGKIVDIDENYKRIQMYDAEAAKPALQKQVLLPILASGESVIRIAEKQVGPVLQGYRTMFETVRLVDPEICMQVSTTKESHSVQKNEDCFALWGKSRRCERCISQDAIRMGKIQTKVEPIGNDVYYVFAMPIEIDGMSYSLECVNPIRSEDINGIESEHVLNQLLVRNRQVYVDSATRVYNRRYYDERVRNLSGEYALAMIDIDNFKKINDRFGHTAGDAALYYVAQTIRSMLRSNDALIRYGGDEFFLLFDNMPEQILERKLGELCRAVRKIEVAQYPELKLTISIGDAYASGRISDLIQKADAALYEAKKEKNRAVIF